MISARSFETAYFFGPFPCAPSGVAQTTSAAMTRAYLRIGPSLFQDLLRNRVQLHVARPLVDRTDLGVAVELLNRVLLGVAVAAKQLYRQRGDPLCYLRGEELGHRRLRRVWLTRRLEPGGVVHHQPGRLELGGGLRQLKLDRLKFPDRSEEHTSELQSRLHLVCRLLLEKKKKLRTVTIISKHRR